MCPIQIHFHQWVIAVKYRQKSWAEHLWDLTAGSEADRYKLAFSSQNVFFHNVQVVSILAPLIAIPFWANFRKYTIIRYPPPVLPIVFSLMFTGRRFPFSSSTCRWLRRRTHRPSRASPGLPLWPWGTPFFARNLPHGQCHRAGNCHHILPYLLKGDQPKWLLTWPFCFRFFIHFMPLGILIQPQGLEVRRLA